MPLLRRRAEEEDVVEPTFDDVLWTLLFMTSLWIGGKMAARLGMPSLVGEIAVGISMGPHGAALVPAAEALMLYGEVGLMLLVLEAGLDVDLAMLKVIGPRGVGVAISGSLMPLTLGAAIASVGFGLDWKASLAVGCALAPTSMGIALNVLKGAGVLNTPTGQLIIAAAVLDDVIALILLAELHALDDPSPLKLVMPVFASVGLMLSIGWLGTSVAPNITQRCLPYIKPKLRDKVLLGALLFLAIILVPCCHQLGSSHLLGAFLAGLCFCTDADAHAAWQQQVKRLLQWLLKIFFAATIGFEVPVRSFAQPEVIWRAAALCVASLGKVATGLWAVPLRRAEFLTVGFAMAAWGEFAFITATTARDTHIIDDVTFSAVILAVLVSVILSPTLLRLTLAHSARTAQMRIEDAMAGHGSGGGGGGGGGPARGGELDAVDDDEGGLVGDAAESAACYRLRLRSAPAWGLSTALTQAVMEQGLVVLDTRSQHGYNPPMVVTEMFVQDLLLSLPPTSSLPSHRDEQLQARLSALHAAIVDAVSGSARDGGKVDLIRWLAGAPGAGRGGSGGSGGSGGGAAISDIAGGVGVSAGRTARSGRSACGRAGGSSAARRARRRGPTAWDEDERFGIDTRPKFAYALRLGEADAWDDDEDVEFEHHGYSYKDFGLAAGLEGFVDYGSTSSRAGGRRAASPLDWEGLPTPERLEHDDHLDFM